MRRYQIDRQRALREFKQRAIQENPPIQMVFPLAEVLAQLQQGLKHFLGTLLREAMQETMEQEVRLLVGKRNQPQADRAASRWGSERGYVVMQGQKVHVGRPRVRDRHNREVPLGSYELFQRASLMEDAVWNSMMRQVSTRKYSELLQELASSYGVKKSTVSDHFIACSREKLTQLLERPLGKLQLCAMLLDGTIFNSEHLIVALGITVEGRKVFLGLRQGSTENGAVVKELLADMQARGVDFEIPRLYVLDGSRAFRHAVQHYAGPAAVVQRCQVHKVRNVVAHLPEGYKHLVKTRMHAAYAMAEHSEAKQALRRLLEELKRRNPSAADSLAEGMEDTLAVHRLRMAPLLRLSLSSTNPIESAFSTTEDICRNVKNWANGDHRLRWLASALLYIESRLHRLQGFRHIPLFIKELELATLRKDLKVSRVGIA